MDDETASGVNSATRPTEKLKMDGLDMFVAIMIQFNMMVCLVSDTAWPLHVTWPYLP